MSRNLYDKQNLTGSTESSGTAARLDSGYKTVCAALILLCLVITAAIAGIRPAAADGTGSGTEAEPWLVSTWSGLYEKLRNDGWIRLTADVTYGQGEGDYAWERLLVDNAEVTLDLNGHTIDRGLKDARAEYHGYVIRVESGGNLTLTDSSTAKTGTVTGGNNFDNGGGVFVSESTFTMTGGVISSNKAGSTGGGVFVYDGNFIMTGGVISSNKAGDMGGGVYVDDSTFTMDGGTISGNTTDYYGGGVYVCDSTFTMTGGTISGNTADNYGGGVVVDGDESTFTMSGGTISSNKTGGQGGGVYVWVNGTFTMSGGTVSGNSADNTENGNGGGVYLDRGTFSISGNPVITGNKKGDSENNSDNNVFLAAGVNITVSGPLTNTTPIGVTLESGTGTFTSGLSGKGVTVNFISDAGYAVGIEQNEACLNNETADRTIYFSGENFFLIDSQAGSLNTVVTLYQNTNPFPNTFRGWNTLSDGTGAHYRDGGNIILTGDVTLYAQWGNAAEIVNGSEYPTLQAAINAAGNDATVKLLTHIDSEELAGGWPLQVGEGKNVTLDLNGFNIDRGLTEAATLGYVIKISGNLTLTDNSQAKTGTVTGGYDNVAGGGVYVDGGTFTMSGGTISGNTADAGGGVYVESGRFIMTGGTISGSTAAVGGGVYVSESGTFTMNGGTISGNRTENVDSGSGGGVYVNSGGTFTMTGGTISGNYADHGGGVDLIGAVFNMSGGSITQNTASQYGGGVSVNNYSSTGGSFIMSGYASITGNKAGGTQSDQGGGGVFVNIYSQFTMNGGAVSSNDAVYGGGIFVKGRSYDNTYGTFTMNDGAVARNTANVGSGVYMYDNGQMSMTGGTISGNAASRSSGGIYVNSNSKFTMTGGTITQNTASQTGGGVYLYYNGTMNISGAPVISGNRLSGGTANNLFLDESGGSSAVISVTGALTNTSPIGITMANPGVFTSGLSGKGTAANFSSDNKLYETGLTAGNEAELHLKLYNVIVTSPAHGTVTASPVSTYGNRTVTLTAAPADNYMLASDGLHVSYTDESGTHTVTVTAGPGVDPVTGAGEWTFTIPTADVTVSAEFISTWTWLQLQLSSADSASVIRLDRDIIWQQGDPAPLTLDRSGVELTLDLNGYTINRGLAEAGEVNDGNVIRIGGGKLTLKDSSASGDVPGTGLITGGKSSNYGGGVYVSGGNFTMEGGTISGCTAAGRGGGVYVDQGSFTMKGGTVSGNKAPFGGGVFVVDDGAGYTRFDKFDLSGSPVITGNTTAGGAAGNVYLKSGTYINVISPLTGADASVGVTIEDGSGRFTDTESPVLPFNDALKFFSDDPAYAVGKDPDTQQLYLGISVYISGISAADKTYDGGTGASLSGTAVLNRVSDDTQVPGLTASGITAVFADKNAGNGKNVSVTGALLSDTNYALDLDKTNEKLGLTASITAKTVTVTGVTAVPRAYEAGNLTAALTGGEVSGKVDGDDVFADLSAAAGTMADADIGTDKPVTVSGVNLGGADAGNYVLSAQPSGVTVTISGDGTAPSGNAALRLPSGLKAVQASAFEGSPSFDEVYLPEGMETIGGRAFADCSGLKLVHIPDSVTSIADDAFAGSLHVIFSCTSGSTGAAYARDHYIMRQNP